MFGRKTERQGPSVGHQFEGYPLGVEPMAACLASAGVRIRTGVDT